MFHCFRGSPVPRIPCRRSLHNTHAVETFTDRGTYRYDGFSIQAVHIRFRWNPIVCDIRGDIWHFGELCKPKTKSLLPPKAHHAYRELEKRGYTQASDIRLTDSPTYGAIQEVSSI